MYPPQKKIHPLNVKAVLSNKAIPRVLRSSRLSPKPKSTHTHTLSRFIISKTPKTLLCTAVANKLSGAEDKWSRGELWRAHTHTHTCVYIMHRRKVDAREKNGSILERERSSWLVTLLSEREGRNLWEHVLSEEELAAKAERIIR